MKRGRWIIFSAILCGTFLWAGETRSANGAQEKTTIVYGQDRNIKVVMKGRAGNLELLSSTVKGEGQILTDYQKGSGFVTYNRERQILTWETKIGYTLNRMSKHIQKVAPSMVAKLPAGSELDFKLDITNLVLGTLDFRDMNFNHFKLDVNYGDVDVTFPSENQSIVRGTARFHLMAGDLEINQLANLKAEKVRINGGTGEVTVDFGPKLLMDSQVFIDLDIGTLELIIPKGTRAIISGTSRDLSDFGFQKQEKSWHPVSYHENSPHLNIRMKGPMGDLTILWK